jgi:hypothetical protein
MANITIPNLPQATSLDGTEQLLGVQSGTSKAITTGQIVSLVVGGGGSTPLAVSVGGTGNTTFDTYGVLYGDGTNPVESIAPPAGADYILVASPGTVPAWQENIPVTAGVNSISFGSTGLTPNTATEGVVTVAGTLATANGGTNLTSFTANGAVYATSTSALTTGTLPAISGGTGQSSFAVGDLLYSDTTTTLAKLADVATGSVLISGGVGVAPSYSASPTLTTSLTTPLLIGGTTASSSLTLQSTSGVGTTDSILFKVGSNGATTAMTISSAGAVSLNTALAVGSGGTGAATFTANGIIYGNTTSALGVTAAGTTGQVLIATTSGAPSWGAIPSTAAVTSITFGTTGLTPNTTTTGAVTVDGTLVAVNGGTGQTSYAVGDLLYADTTTSLAKLADVATGNALISGGVSTAPTWGKIDLTTTISGTLPVANGGTGATTANAALTNLTTFTSTATAAGTTVLTNTSTYFQYFTGTLTQTITLPVTSTLATGWTFHIVNNSTGNLTVNSSGGNLVIPVVPGVTAMVTCIGTTLTTAADWEAGLTDFSTATGTGSVVLATSPTLVTPSLGVATATSLSATTLTATAGAGFQNLEVLTSGASWSLPAALQVTGAKFKITVIGGGGGGGGNAATAATSGAGGGGGGLCVAYLTYVSGQNSVTTSFGAAGAGASNTAGTAGGATTATYNSLTYIGTGGSGGAIGATAAGGAGGTGTTGTGTETFALSGQNGGNAGTTTAVAGVTYIDNSGGGVGLGWGNGGRMPFAGAAGIGGTVGTGYGGGGSGSTAGSTATARAGGNGTAGAIIVEY